MLKSPQSDGGDSVSEGLRGPSTLAESLGPSGKIKHNPRDLGSYKAISSCCPTRYHKQSLCPVGSFFLKAEEQQEKVRVPPLRVVPGAELPGAPPTISALEWWKNEGQDPSLVSPRHLSGLEASSAVPLSRWTRPIPRQLHPRIHLVPHPFLHTRSEPCSCPDPTETWLLSWAERLPNGEAE